MFRFCSNVKGHHLAHPHMVKGVGCCSDFIRFASDPILGGIVCFTCTIDLSIVTENVQTRSVPGGSQILPRDRAALDSFGQEVQNATLIKLDF